MTKSAPKVSVLLPVYNGEKYLKTAIDSILNQTYANLSLIIIDDGSTDGSRDIIDSYKDTRICVLENEVNSGLIFSLNKGLDACDGDYVARMDSDDYSFAVRLEKQVEFMENHPKVGVCSTWYSVFNEELTENLYTVMLPEDPEILRTVLFTNSCLCHPSSMFRMAYFNKYNLRYNPAYKHAEDYGLWMECSKYFELSNVPEVLLCYRSTPTGICHLHAPEQKNSTCKILTENLKNIGINNLDKELLEFHFRVVYGSEKISSYEDKLMLIKWFNTLQDANSETQYYNNNYFLDLLTTKAIRLFM